MMLMWRGVLLLLLLLLLLALVGEMREVVVVKVVVMILVKGFLSTKKRLQPDRSAGKAGYVLQMRTQSPNTRLLPTS